MSADPSAVVVVRAWLAAANAGAAEDVLALTEPDVVLVGPRGRGRGHDVLRRWLAGAGATFEPLRSFARGHAVVMAQHAVWRDGITGAVVGEAEVATRFVLRQGRVAELERHATLPAALEAAGLTEADERPAA